MDVDGGCGCGAVNSGKRHRPEEQTDFIKERKQTVTNLKMEKLLANGEKLFGVAVQKAPSFENKIRT